MPELSGAVLRRTETSRQKQGNPEGVQLLKGSWDLVTRVINKVTILIITYNPN